MRQSFQLGFANQGTAWLFDAREELAGVVSFPCLNANFLRQTAFRSLMLAFAAFLAAAFLRPVVKPREALYQFWTVRSLL
jgi:hypothetical protein